MSSYYTKVFDIWVTVQVRVAWLRDIGFTTPDLLNPATLTERSILQIKDSSGTNRLVRLKPTFVTLASSYTVGSHTVITGDIVTFSFPSTLVYEGMSTLTAMFESANDVDNRYTTTHVYQSVTVTKIAENSTANVAYNRGIITDPFGYIKVSVPRKLVNNAWVNKDKLKFKVTGPFTGGKVSSIYLPALSLVHTSNKYSQVMSSNTLQAYSYNEVYNYEVLLSESTDLDGTTSTIVYKVGSGSFRVVKPVPDLTIRD